MTGPAIVVDDDPVEGGTVVRGIVVAGAEPDGALVGLVETVVAGARLVDTTTEVVDAARLVVDGDVDPLPPEEQAVTASATASPAVSLLAHRLGSAGRTARTAGHAMRREPTS